MDDYLLTKKIKVSDPDYWYGETEIEVRMERFLQLEDTVRIMFRTADWHRAIYKDFNEWDFYNNWKWCRYWFWDKIPEIISSDWLCERGYVPY